MLNIAKGKLTYAVAIFMIAYGITGLVLEIGDSQVNHLSIANGLGFFGVRRAL